MKHLTNHEIRIISAVMTVQNVRLLDYGAASGYILKSACRALRWAVRPPARPSNFPIANANRNTFCKVNRQRLVMHLDY